MGKDVNIIDIILKIDGRRVGLNGIIKDSKLFDLFIQSVVDGCHESVVTIQNNAVKAECSVKLKRMYEYLS